MANNELKPGDRVRVYDMYTLPEPKTGKIRQIRGKYYDVELDEEVHSDPGMCKHFSFYRQQLRKLKSPRRIYIQRDELEAGLPATAWPNTRGCSDYVEFIEVKRK